MPRPSTVHEEGTGPSFLWLTRIVTTADEWRFESAPLQRSQVTCWATCNPPPTMVRRTACHLRGGNSVSALGRPTHRSSLDNTRFYPRALLRSSALAVLLVSVGITFAGFLTSLLLNRGLGPIGRGQLAAALVVASLLPYLASVGIANSVLYYSGPSAEVTQRTLATAIPIGLLQSAIAGAATYLLIPVLLGEQGSDVVASARYALWSLPANILTLYLASAFQSRLRFGMFNALRSIVPAGAL